MKRRDKEIDNKEQRSLPSLPPHGRIEEAVLSSGRWRVPSGGSALFLLHTHTSHSVLASGPPPPTKSSSSGRLALILPRLLSRSDPCVDFRVPLAG